MKVWQGIIIGMVVGAVAAWLLHPHPKAERITEVVTEVVTRHDTVVVDRPVERLRTVLRCDTLRLVTTERDTVAVVMEREQRVYSDSTYCAWVSGYDPRLDSIAVRHTTEQVLVTRTEKHLVRWGIGVMAGVSATPTGFQPSIGIGITYTILGF